VVEVLHTEGLQNILRHLNENIKSCTKQITSNSFKSLSEVTALQGEISGLRKAFNYIEACKERVNREVQ